MEKMQAGKQELFEAIVEAMVNYELEGKEIELMMIAEVTADVCKFKKIRLSHAEFALAVNRIFLKARSIKEAVKEPMKEIQTVSKPLAVRKIQRVQKAKKVKAVKVDKK